MYYRSPRVEGVSVHLPIDNPAGSSVPVAVHRPAVAPTSIPAHLPPLFHATQVSVATEVSRPDAPMSAPIPRPAPEAPAFATHSMRLDHSELSHEGMNPVETVVPL